MGESSSRSRTEDFSFVLKSPSVLKKAVEALCDPTFKKPMQHHEAMIQVGKDGFDIIVDFMDEKNKNRIFGYLHLKATGLQEFQCNVPLQKMGSLKLINQLLTDASENEDRGIRIYSDPGSKKLFFRWGGAVPGCKFGTPVFIKLSDVKQAQQKLPTLVNYGFEAVIPSDILKDAFTKLLPSRIKPNIAKATLVAPKVRIILDKEIILSTEEEAEWHEVLFSWKYWESLQKATLLADECRMYLIRDPPQLSEYVMLRIKLLELGDLVYLIPADFLTDNTLNNLYVSRSLPFTRD